MRPQPRMQDEKHTSIVTTVTPDSPGIPRAMVYGLFRALPGDRAFLSPSPAALAADLTSASRRQDHTTSPSASALFVRSASASTASRPAFVTIASRPSEWDGTVADRKVICANTEAEYFSRWGWTGKSVETQVLAFPPPCGEG